MEKRMARAASTMPSETKSTKAISRMIKDKVRVSSTKETVKSAKAISVRTLWRAHLNLWQHTLKLKLTKFSTMLRDKVTSM